MSAEYRKVFVRGCCVDFSPTGINQYLERSIEEVANLEVTDNEVYKTITGNMVKKWPRKDKL
ncbi:envelope-like protein, partial [Trifolium medium]|nr:envelope-like protein [Trifolium medium]